MQNCILKDNILIIAPPCSLKNAGISVPPPKNDMRKGVFVIIIFLKLILDYQKGSHIFFFQLYSLSNYL